MNTPAAAISIQLHFFPFIDNERVESLYLKHWLYPDSMTPMTIWLLHGDDEFPASFSWRLKKRDTLGDRSALKFFSSDCNVSSRKKQQVDYDVRSSGFWVVLVAMVRYNRNSPNFAPRTKLLVKRHSCSFSRNLHF
jgi:hypothetical protein